MLRFIAPCIIGLLTLTAQAFAMRPYHPTHPDPFSESWRWTQYSELKGQGLRCLTQTTDGTMWFGTDSGIKQYDGQTWTDHTPKNGLLGAPVYALCATKDNRLFAGSEQGVSLFEKGAWRPYFPTKNALPWPVNTLYETSDGQLWAGTPWGALHLHPEQPVLYTTAETAKALSTLSPDVATIIIPDDIVPPLHWHPRDPYAGVGLRALEGSWASLRSRNMPRVIWHLAPDGPAQKAGLQIGDYISAVDGMQPAWTNDAIYGPPGTQVALTIQRPGQAKPFDVHPTRTAVPGTFRECLVYSIVEDSENVLWFGLARGEIIRTPIQQSRLNPARTWHRFAQKDGIQLEYAPVLRQIKGQIWATAQSGNKGLYRFDGQTWHLIVPTMSGSDMLEMHDGVMLVASRSLFTLQNDSLSQLSLPAYAPHNYIRFIEAQDGALWLAGLGEGVARFDYQTTRWQTFQDLMFFCETPANNMRWFQTLQRNIVSQHKGKWWILDPQDGLMDRPEHLIALDTQRLLAIGYHNKILATAIFNGTTWTLTQHPECQIKGPIRTAIYAQDGSLWLGGTLSYGVFQYSPDGVWHHHIPPEAPAPAACLAQTKNGDIWVGGWYGLRRFDGQTWHVIADHTGLTSYIDALLSDAHGELWVGTRLYGIFQYTGKTWSQYSMAEGVADINISQLIEANDGSILAVTRGGISRFDNETWTPDALPRNLSMHIMSTAGTYPNVSQTNDGAFWINTLDKEAIYYQPSSLPPNTQITSALTQVSHPGNTAISWTGSTPWKTTPDEDLQFSYRIDNGPWSPFSHKTNHIFLALSSGSHTFEVRTRDRDFNVDPTPAAMHFQVEAPFWRHPAFLTLLSLLCAAIALQTRRAIQHSRQLRASHRALETALRDLQSTQQRLHTVVTGAPVIFWAIDLQGSLTFLQGKEQEILGLAELDVLGSSVFDLFASNQALCADLHRALHGEAFTSVRDILGTTFEIRHSPLHNAEGHHVGAIGVATDITERLKAESERQQLDEKLRFLRYLYHLRTALGQARTPAEILEQAGTALSTTLSSAVSAHVSLQCDTCTWATGLPVTDGAFSYRRPLSWNNHHRGSLTVTTSVRLTESQERAFLDETTAQITTALEARELEAQLLQSARLVSLGQMAAGVAHELNQPLAAISATAEGVLLRIEDGLAVSSKRVTTMMEDIMGLVDRMIASINHLRIFSRDTSQEPGGEFSVNNAIGTSLKMIGAQLKSHGIHVALDLTPELPQVLGHPHQIEQVMLNLVNNAKDAMEEKMSQNPQSPYAKQLHIRTTCANECVVIEVTDNGTGIDPDHLQRLFEPFYTTKPADKGTGIGLSIVYAIVKNHGGEITCHSQKGHHTTFRVMLPTIAKESPHDNHRPHIEHTAH